MCEFEEQLKEMEKFANALKLELSAAKAEIKRLNPIVTACLATIKEWENGEGNERKNKTLALNAASLEMYEANEKKLKQQVKALNFALSEITENVDIKELKIELKELKMWEEVHHSLMDTAFKELTELKKGSEIKSKDSARLEKQIRQLQQESNEAFNKCQFLDAKLIKAEEHYVFMLWKKDKWKAKAKKLKKKLLK